MAANLEILARDKGLKGNEFKSVRDTLMAQAAQIRALGGPEHLPASQIVLATETSPAQPQAADAKPSRPLQPVALEIPTVSEELYNRTREALAKEGFTHVVTIQPVSMGQLATDETTGRRFAYINSSEAMRAVVSPQMEVAIDPRNVRIRNSNRKSTDTQLRMTAEDEARLRGRLPEDVRGLVRMPMHDPSTLSQADLDYQERTGKPLYPDFWLRTNVETVPGLVADVGRLVPSDQLRVFVWRRGLGLDNVFAGRAVVLPRKLVIEQPAE